MKQTLVVSRLRLDIYLRGDLSAGWFEQYAAPDGTLRGAERVFRRAKNWEVGILRQTDRATKNGVVAVRVRADNEVVAAFTADPSIELDGPVGRRPVSPLFDIDEAAGAE